MKVILISLPNKFLSEPAMNPSLGLGYLSSYLKSKGFDVTVVDLNLQPTAIPVGADAYGISCTTPQYYEFVKTASSIRARCPDSLIIVGGPHASNCPEDFKGLADVCIAGEGEYALEKALNGERSGGPLPNRVRDLDKLPFPDRSDLSLYRRTVNGKKAVHIVTLRGCPYECAFCDRHSVGRWVRYRSVSNVLKEIDQLRFKHDISSFVIYDDIFTMDEYRVQQFCHDFKWRALKWRCWSRTDTVTREMLGVMKYSGLTSITFGVESGDDGILENINKVATVEDNRNAILWAKSAGIPVRCSLMYGNPGETRQSVKNTIKFIEDTQPDEWNLAVLTPVPGSAIWRDPGRFGVRFDRQWVKDEFYKPCNRFGSTGVGDPWVELDSMSKDEFTANLNYMVRELERVCPRKNIQDTVQDIKL